MSENSAMRIIRTCYSGSVCAPFLFGVKEEKMFLKESGFPNPICSLAQSGSKNTFETDYYLFTFNSEEQAKGGRWGDERILML